LSLLKAKQADCVQTFFWKEGELLEENFVVQEVDMADVAIPVAEREDQPGYETVAHSLKIYGLFFPVILLENTRHNYDKSVEFVTPRLILPYYQAAPWLAFTGGQRITAARSLGFTRISAIIVPDIHWAHSAQVAIRGF
jgi:hypothetical protein